VKGHNQIRIISGRWRGRKLSFPPASGLRPTPDRIRETLFNWLQPGIAGARCLDLFAGSGALGWEALSRGAAEVVMVDSNRQTIQNLKNNRELLNAEDLTIIHHDALGYLEKPATPFDIIFLDPPFRQGFVAKCSTILELNGWLTLSAQIYLETESELQELPVPAKWTVLHSKKAGQVSYNLAERSLEHQT